MHDTIIFGDLQIYSEKNNKIVSWEQPKLGNRFLDSEKFYDGDYDCYRNHEHERAKNACKQRLAKETEKIVGLQNRPSGFTVHHVLCLVIIVVHNSVSFNGSLLLVVFLVFFDVGFLLGICLYDKDNAQNNPEDRTGRVVTSGKCAECAERTEDDRDNSKCFHDSMTL